MERGPEDRRHGSQRSDESTRRNAMGIAVGAFVGALVGGMLGVSLVGNVYLGSGSVRRSVRFSEVLSERELADGTSDRLRRTERTET
jgi:hypothetical protein